MFYTDLGPNEPLKLNDMFASPGHLIRRCHQISTALFLEELSEWEITPVQYSALIAIKDYPGLDQRGLAKIIAFDRSTVATMLQRLEEKGFISRKTPEHNQRIKQLFITPKGISVLKQSRKAIDVCQQRILEPLTEKERVSFMKVITKLANLNNANSRAPLEETLLRQSGNT